MEKEKKKCLDCTSRNVLNRLTTGKWKIERGNTLFALFSVLFLKPNVFDG